MPSCSAVNVRFQLVRFKPAIIALYSISFNVIISDKLIEFSIFFSLSGLFSSILFCPTGLTIWSITFGFEITDY